MNAFSAAVDRLFLDQNLAIDATFRDQQGAETSVRVMLQRPDEVVGWGASRAVTDTALADLRVSDVSAPLVGDVLVIGEETFEINGEPKKDRERLVWRLELVPA